MQRVLVIGSGGAGKTVLASDLAARLSLPVVHLDDLYYDGTGQPRPQEDFAATQRGLVATPRFVLDGNYATTMPLRLAAADTVIFLDLPARTCLLGIALRRWRYGGGHHPLGVHNRINLAFLRYVVSFRRRMRPRVLILIAEHAPDVTLIQLTSRRQVRRFLTRLTG